MDPAADSKPDGAPHAPPRSTAFAAFFSDDRWPEWVMATILAGLLIKVIVFTAVNLYLPQPFFYEPSDTFADWFNTAFWARNAGTYDTWTTLYPPLTFVFLRIFGFDRCYPQTQSVDPSAGLAARDCDWLGISTIFGLFLIDLVLIYLTLRKVDRRTALPRSLCVGLGWPMLDGLERGNLVLACFACFVLAVGPLLGSARTKAVFAGLAINFKVYLIASILPLVIKRRWRWVEQAVIATVFVYLVSFAVMGRGTVTEIVRNIRDFSSNPTTQVLDLWPAATYKPAISFLASDSFPITLLLGSRMVETLERLLPLLVMTGQAAILIAAGLAALRPDVITRTRLVTHGTMLALITSEAGGYTPVFFMVLVLMEPWRGFGRKFAISATYLLGMSLDVTLDKLPSIVRDSYIGNTQTIVEFGVTAAPFVRPFVILAIAFAMACVTIREVCAAMWPQRVAMPVRALAGGERASSLA